MSRYEPVEDLEWDEMDPIITDDDLDPEPIIDLENLPDVVNDHPEG